MNSPSALVRRRSRTCVRSWLKSLTGILACGLAFPAWCGDISVSSDPWGPNTSYRWSRVSGTGGVDYVAGTVRADDFSGLPNARRDYFLEIALQTPAVVHTATGAEADIRLKKTSFPDRIIGYRHVEVPQAVEFGVFNPQDRVPFFQYSYPYTGDAKPTFVPLPNGGVAEVRDGGFFNEVTLFNPDGTVRSAKHYVSAEFGVSDSHPDNAVLLRGWALPDSGVLVSRVEREFNEITQELISTGYFQKIDANGGQLWAKKVEVPDIDVRFVANDQVTGHVGFATLGKIGEPPGVNVFGIGPDGSPLFSQTAIGVSDACVSSLPGGNWALAGTIPDPGGPPDCESIILSFGTSGGVIEETKSVLSGFFTDVDVSASESLVCLSAEAVPTAGDDAGYGNGYVGVINRDLDEITLKAVYRDVSSIKVAPSADGESNFCSMVLEDVGAIQAFKFNSQLQLDGGCDLLVGVAHENWVDIAGPFTPSTFQPTDFPVQVFTNPISFGTSSLSLETFDVATGRICAEGGGFPVDLSTGNADVDVFGGSRTVQVETFGAWTATSNAAWMHITSPTGGNGTGSGSVSLQFDANTTDSTRTGVFSINAFNLEFHQAALSAPVAVRTSGTTDLPTGGGAGTLDVVSAGPVDVVASPFITTTLIPAEGQLVGQSVGPPGIGGTGGNRLTLPGGVATIAWSVDNSAPLANRSGTIRIVDASDNVLYSLTITQPGTGGVAPVNLSARTQVGSGANILIPGLVASGPGKTRVLVRGVGPSLGDLGVSGTLQDPRIALYLGATRIGENDSWAVDRTALRALFSELGAFELTSDSDSAAVFDLDPGAYTVHLSGADGGSGVGIVEIYALDAAADHGLVNLSARAEVGTGDRVMIPGLVISGDRSVPVLIRGVGPSLEQFGVANFLDDPVIDVRDGNGDPIGGNDDWSTTADLPALKNAIAAAGAFELDDGSTDAAVLLTLAPGVYTAVIRGKGASIGVALLEVYFLPTAP